MFPSDPEQRRRIAQSGSLVTISQIAKDYGMSGQALNELLHELGVQYRQNGQWLLYSKYQHEGYVRSNTLLIEHDEGDEAKMHTMWTGKGRLFLYELLGNHGVWPLGHRP